MSEESVKVASLVEKLAGWVEAQPEYPFLFLADRGRRKRAATIVARRLLLIPTIAPDPNGVDRETAQKRDAAIKKVIGGFKTQMSEKQRRELAKAEAMRRRYGKLSIERAHELALRLNADVDAQANMVAEMERLVADGEAYDGPEFEYEEGEQDVEADVEAP